MAQDKPMNLQVLFLLILSFGLFWTGCSKQSAPERAMVSGTATYEGKPVEEGTIAFIPIEGTKGPVAGGVVQEGQYKISAANGPVIGKHRVEILGNRKTGKQMEAVPPASGTVDEIEQYIPPKYNTTSTLTADIKQGDNTADFDLKK